jgi:hypothetical protein
MGFDWAAFCGPCHTCGAPCDQACYPDCPEGEIGTDDGDDDEQG